MHDAHVSRSVSISALSEELFLRHKLLLTASALSATVALLFAHRAGADAAVSPPIARTANLNFIVTLPLRNEGELEALVASQSDPHSPLYRHFLTKAQFRAAYGPTAAALASAAGMMRQAGFTVSEITSQGLKVSGTPNAIMHTFGVTLTPSRVVAGAQRMAAGQRVHLSPALAALGAQVVGLADLPRKHVFSRVVARPDNRSSNAGAYWFTDLKQAYAYPSFSTGLIGKGVTIGIVIDSAVNAGDLTTYFEHEHFTANSKGAPIPSLAIRPVLGGAPITSQTDLYNPNGDGIEAALDMEQSLGSAPGASGVIYDIPSLGDDAILAGYTDVVEDNAVDVVSSSFGGCELAYSPAYNNGQDFSGVLKTYHAIFVQGNAQGITFLASSGDEAGLECPSVAYAVQGLPGKFVPSISFPASDPSVTAVGGTNLVTTTPAPGGKPSLTSKYVTENAYGDPEIPYDPYGLGVAVSGGVWGSGSGPSFVYSRPPYQQLVDTHNQRRSIPDISMQMGGCPGGISILGGPDDFCGYAPPLYDKQPRSYVATYYSGPGTSSSGYIGLIGTSASSPEFAGLLAIKAQTLKSRLGNANPLIYQLAAANYAFATPFYHEGIPGYNGVVRMVAYQHGWSRINGVGTPIAQNFLGVPNGPVAGDPQTASNP